jgi:hypothetical protein
MAADALPGFAPDRRAAAVVLAPRPLAGVILRGSRAAALGCAMP